MTVLGGNSMAMFLGASGSGPELPEPIDDEVDILLLGAVIRDAGSQTEAISDPDGSQEGCSPVGEMSQDLLIARLVGMAEAKAHSVQRDRGEDFPDFLRPESAFEVSRQIQHVLDRIDKGPDPERLQGAPDLQGFEPSRKLRTIVHEVGEEWIWLGG